MDLTPANSVRASRALEAVLYDQADKPRAMAGRERSLQASIRLSADLMHLFDRYELDLSTAVSSATYQYCEAQTEADRGGRAAGLRRRPEHRRTRMHYARKEELAKRAAKIEKGKPTRVTGESREVLEASRRPDSDEDDPAYS